jgi:hypothetical protein
MRVMELSLVLELAGVTTTSSPHTQQGTFGADIPS